MLFSAWVPIVMSFLLCVGGSFLWRRGKINKQAADLKLQNVIPKKRKGRKNSKYSITTEKRDSEVIRETETTNIFLPLKTSKNYVNCTNKRNIVKLVVTNKEIAKGSNWTIVLEGHYDSRSVDVKRLVRTHHNMAVKEIHNLIAFDQHSNIVRCLWN